jgi:hypothetical protein
LSLVYLSWDISAEKWIWHVGNYSKCPGVCRVSVCIFQNKTKISSRNQVLNALTLTLLYYTCGFCFLLLSLLRTVFSPSGRFQHSIKEKFSLHMTHTYTYTHTWLLEHCFSHCICLWSSRFSEMGLILQSNSSRPRGHRRAQ